MATDTMDVRGASERIQCLPHEAPVAAILISGLVLAVSVTTSLLWQPSIRGYPSLVWALALIPALLLSYYKSWRGSLIILVVATVLLAAADVGRQLSASLTTWELVGVLVIVLLAVSLGAGFVSDARRLNALNALKSANVDAETGLPNQLVFNIALEKEFAALSWGRTFSVARFSGVMRGGWIFHAATATTSSSFSSPARDCATPSRSPSRPFAILRMKSRVPTGK
jgi:hypothetical protein